MMKKNERWSVTNEKELDLSLTLSRNNTDNQKRVILRPTGQGLFLQSYCISSIHGGPMWGVTSTWTCEVEFCQEQEPRAASGTAAGTYEVNNAGTKLS